MESLTARAAWSNAFQILKEHNSQLFYPAKMPAVVDGRKKIKLRIIKRTFHDRSILKKIQVKFQTENNNQHS